MGRFDDFLEGLTEFRRAVTLMVMVYYSEWIQIKSRKGKRCLLLESKKDKGDLPFVLPQNHGKSTLFYQQQYETTHVMSCQSGRLT